MPNLMGKECHSNFNMLISAVYAKNGTCMLHCIGLATLLVAPKLSS